jgi:uncharacterized SAM-binding protein YcdF (DUF218 family)
MNQLLLSLGIESWKPALGALLLPPVPFLVMVLVGAVLTARRALLGWALVLLACAGIWLSTTTAVAHHLQRSLLKPPPVLQPAQVAALRRAPQTAIVVLGGGRTPLAQEYGTSQLHPRSIERLRYGVFLARQTGLPMAFSGGVGWGGREGASEAAIAGRTAETELGFKIRWQEAESRDTRQNAARTVSLLREQGVQHIVLVTHDYHMPRASRAFRQAVAAAGVPMQLTPAPMGVGPDGPLRAGDWLPSLSGAEETRIVLHEWLGLLSGA